jgi:ABC-type uncharacterized transport system permease subunit
MKVDVAYKHFMQSAFDLDAQIKLARSAADYILRRTTLSLTMVSQGEISRMLLRPVTDVFQLKIHGAEAQSLQVRAR